MSGVGSSVKGRAAGVAVLALSLLALAGCSDMEFSQKHYKFNENQKRTIGFYIVKPGKYKIEEILTELDFNGRFTLEKEACKGWEGEVVKEGEAVGCLFWIESKGLLVGEEVTLTGKYERVPAVVMTPTRAKLTR